MEKKTENNMENIEKSCENNMEKIQIKI